MFRLRAVLKFSLVSMLLSGAGLNAADVDPRLRARCGASHSAVWTGSE
jgi:hypothetical protein